MHRAFRLATVLAVLTTSLMTFAPAPAQVPIPLQEQIRIFNSLPAAQQQSLIRELQSQLPPAQRDAILGMLQQGRDPRQQAVSTGEAELPTDFETTEPLDFRELIPKFGAGDTLVIEFVPREEPTIPLTAQEEQELPELLARFENGNPYRLDGAGRLYLPGVPAIELAGLDVDQATIRLRADANRGLLDIQAGELDGRHARQIEPAGAIESVGVAVLEAGE